MTDQLSIDYGQLEPAPVEAATELAPKASVPMCTSPLARLKQVTPPSAEERPTTLCACLDWVLEQLGPLDAGAKQVLGAVRTVLKVVHRRVTPEGLDLPAAPSLLRPILLAALPAALKVSRSRWQNSKSLLIDLLIATGWVSPNVRMCRHHGGSCNQLLGLLEGQEAGGALRPFLRFCARQEIRPEGITTGVLEDYETWLETRTLELRPRNTVNLVASGWRRIQKLEADWPRQELILESRVRQKAAPYLAFPPSLEADVNAYLNALRDPDPLDPEAGRPLSEITVQHTRRYLMRAATYLRDAGTPANAITEIASLVELQAFREIARGLHADGRPLLEAAGETTQWTKVAYDISLVLLTAARRWVRVPTDTQAALKLVQARIKPRRGGMSQRVQNMLAELMTDAERAELFALPWHAFEIADTMLRGGERRRGAKLHETALALALVLQHPMRMRDLVSLDPVNHFLCNKRGLVHQVAITASKNRVQVRFEVPPELAQRIAKHTTVFRPHIFNHATTTALFPGKHGEPREAQSLGRHIRRLVADQLGKRFTAHMARHLAVDILLDDDPSNIAAAQRLLGHTNSKITQEVYGARATLSSSRKFSELIREQAVRAGAASRPKDRAVRPIVKTPQPAKPAISERKPDWPGGAS